MIHRDRVIVSKNDVVSVIAQIFFVDEAEEAEKPEFITINEDFSASSNEVYKKS